MEVGGNSCMGTLWEKCVGVGFFFIDVCVVKVLNFFVVKKEFFFFLVYIFCCCVRDRLPRQAIVDAKTKREAESAKKNEFLSVFCLNNCICYLHFMHSKKTIKTKQKKTFSIFMCA